ncbi:MAG: DUF2156 domain-containing protein [Candidatus Sigynarchaeota archaeon]
MLRGYKPIEIGDKGTFDKYFKAYPPEISEYTFTNLYMWRRYYEFGWKIADGHLCLISTKEKGKIKIFPPVGEHPASVLPSIIDDVKASEFIAECHRVPEALMQQIQQLGMHVEIVDDRDNWDYVYRAASLSTLDGPEYADFRKKLSRFNRDHDVQYGMLDDTLVEGVLNLQDDWCNLRGCHESEGLSHENAAIKDALEHWKQLGFSGCVMQEQGRIIAYALGEWLNPRTIVCHVEKANPRPSFFGAYQAIAKSFADHCAIGFEFINREQDIGEPGLRRAKESYNPEHMVKKYKAIFK